MQEPKFFTNEEFETMFEVYDLANETYVSYRVLLQALRVAGVARPVEALEEDFPELNPDSKVSRPKFVQVLMFEFTKNGYSY